MQEGAAPYAAVRYHHPVTRETNRRDPEARLPDEAAWPSVAQGRVATAVKAGKITPGPCEWILEGGSTCGAEPTVAHHDDYARPLDVRWLCRSHHPLAHRNVKKRRPDATTASLISARRFREQIELVTQPVLVMKRVDDGSREIIGMWLPAKFVDELSR